MSERKEYTEDEIRVNLVATYKHIETLPERTEDGIFWDDETGEEYETPHITEDCWVQDNWGLGERTNDGGCNTAACYAGWYCALHHPRSKEGTSTYGDQYITYDVQDFFRDMQKIGLGGFETDMITDASNSLEDIAEALTLYADVNVLED